MPNIQHHQGNVHIRRWQHFFSFLFLPPRPPHPPPKRIIFQEISLLFRTIDVNPSFINFPQATLTEMCVIHIWWIYEKWIMVMSCLEVTQHHFKFTVGDSDRFDIFNTYSELKMVRWPLTVNWRRDYRQTAFSSASCSQLIFNSVLWISHVDGKSFVEFI